jgi:Mn2+/Fe2+ NRAMP family transporter
MKRVAKKRPLKHTSRNRRAPRALPADDPERSFAVGHSKPRLLQVLGPGLITGASDDDPSGIATYSQAGAQYGYAMAWTMIFTYPLMAAVQEISARVGRTTGRGLAGNIIRVFPPWAVYPLVLLLLAANIINIGANLGAMGEVVFLLVGGGHLLFVLLSGIICMLLQVTASLNETLSTVAPAASE